MHQESIGSTHTQGRHCDENTIKYERDIYKNTIKYRQRVSHKSHFHDPGLLSSIPVMNTEEVYKSRHDPVSILSVDIAIFI